MSRIGKKTITVPKGTKVNVSGNKIAIEGSKGKLDHTMPAGVNVDVKDDCITVKGNADSRLDRMAWGTTRAIIANMVKGVSEGYTKQLEIVGVGYRAQVQANKLNLQLRFTHPVIYTPPQGVSIEVPKPTQIVIKGIDKAKVGHAAAEIRAILPPEPYKGKGIRYVGEYVRKKLGKAVSKEK